MNSFDYTNTLPKLLVPEVVDALTAIYEYRGKEALYRKMRPAELGKLRKIALVQSVESSNRIEGVATSRPRLKKLMLEQARPKDRNEREIAGYRRVLDLIHTSHEGIDVKPNVILQLHQYLYSEQQVGFAGRWKDSDNAIMERHTDGKLYVRFKPTSAVATPGAMESLCSEYNCVVNNRSFDALLASLVFIFDFVSIHPFSDGNGRMSRLLALLLLYKCGFSVGRYISVEKAIEDTKSTYYEVLADSSYGWETGVNTYKPFVNYMLGVILSCYKQLDERMALLVDYDSSGAVVRSYFEHSLGKQTKADVVQGCPSLSERTVERILKRMVDQGTLERVGAGRSTAYIYKGWD